MAPLVNNKQISEEYLLLQSMVWKRLFPMIDPRFDAGGCQKVILTKRQSLSMPAGTICMVETTSESAMSVSSWIPAGGCQSLPTRAEKC